MKGIVSGGPTRKEGGKRTGTECTPEFHTAVHDGEDDVFGEPVLVAVHLVVPVREHLHLKAGEHQLGAEESRVRQA